MLGHWVSEHKYYLLLWSPPSDLLLHLPIQHLWNVNGGKQRRVHFAERTRLPWPLRAILACHSFRSVSRMPEQPDG